MRNTLIGMAAALAAATLWTPSAAQADTVPHRITANATMLYDSVTGAAFTPRGANYVRLTAAHGGSYHSTFEPGRYSPSDAQNVLNGLKYASGYNTVRVFIDVGDGRYDHGLAADPGTLYSLADDRGAINGRLATVVRPDPCER